MADNLGTLWFGADIDISQLKQTIQRQNKDILDALKMSYDPKSYQDMVNNLRSALGSETFQIKVSTDAQNVAQNLRQQLGRNGGMTGGLDELNERIKAQTITVSALQSRLDQLVASYAQLKGAGKLLSAGNLRTQIADTRRELALEKQTLRDFKAERTALRSSTQDSLLNLRREAAEQRNAAGAAQQSYRQRRQAVQELNSDHMRLNTTLAGGIHISTQLGSALSSLFAVHAAKQFLDNVIEIGGQLEKQRISIGAILGDTVKANHLFEQIKELAVKSPFGVVELDQYTKQLSAYGFQYNELFDMTKRLADISAGAGQDIGRLTLALGHVRSATYLTGITLRQFSMNNIPMLKMLADYYTEVEKRAVTTAEVQQRISKRQVSYEDVIEQIRRLTDEGGMFYNMQEKISESLAAKFKNLRDAMDIMYGEMAESGVGDMLKDLASVLLGVTRNWQVIGKVLGVAAAAFVLNKTSIGLNTLAMQANTAAGVKQIMTDKQVVAAKLRQDAITRTLTVSERAAVLTSNQLRVADLKQALAAGTLDKQEALRLVTLKQIKIAQAMHLVGVQNITKAEVQAAVAANRWKVALSGIGVSLKNAFAGIGTGTWLTLAMMAGTAIYASYDQWTDRIESKAEEMKDLIKSRINDLKKMRDELKEEGMPKDSVALQGRVDEMKQVLANSEAYTKTLDEQLSKTKDLPGQYKILAEAIENAAEKNRKLLDWQDNAAAAITASSLGQAEGVFNHGFFEFPLLNYFFNDDVKQNLSDTLDSYKELRAVIESMWEYKDAMKSAIDDLLKSAEVTEQFKDQIRKAPFEEQLRLIVESGYWDMFKDRVAESNMLFLNFSDGLVEAAQEVTKGWDEIADDDVPRMVKKLASRLNMSEDEFRTWCLNNVDDFNDMLEAINDQIGNKEPEIRSQLKRIFYDYVRFKDIEKDLRGVHEGALVGASIFSDDYLKKLLNEDKKADIKDSVSAGGSKDGKKAEREAEKAAKARTKQMEAQLKIEEELAKQRLELQDAIADAEVAAIENNAERERAQREVEFEKQKRQIEKQAEEWKKKAFELAKNEYEANPKNKTVSFFDTPTGKAGWQGISLTAEQEKILEANYKKLAAERQRYERELHEQQLKYMRDYLKEFGTVQQKRYAIQKEYDDKIAKEIDAEQRRLLEAQKKKALDALDLEVLKAEIDWTTMFDGIGNALEEEMKATLEKVEKFIQSKAFKGLDAKEQSEYVKLRNELYQKTGSGVGTFDFSIYHQIGEDLKAYQHAVKAAKIATIQHEEAEKKLNEADKELTAAAEKLKNNTPETWAEAMRQYQEAQAKYQKANKAFMQTGEEQDEAESQVIVTKGNLVRDESAAEKALTDFSDALSEMTNGTLRGFADGLVNVINAIGGKELTGLKGISKTGGVIAAILSIIDAIGNNKEGLSGVVAEIIDKIINVITTIIDQITNGDFFRNINTAVGEGVQKLLEHLFNSIVDIFSNHLKAWENAFNGDFSSGLQEGFGVGGFFGKIFGERDDENFSKLKTRYESLIDTWDILIDRKKEYLEMSYGVEAMRISKEQQDLQAKKIEAQSDLIRRYLEQTDETYGDLSNGRQLWQDVMGSENQKVQQEIKDAAKSLGVTYQELYALLGTVDENGAVRGDFKGLAGLDLETLDKFLDTELGQRLYAEDENLKGFIETLRSMRKELDDMEKAEQEKLTTTTLSNVIDDFKESLYDLADGSEDATEKIAENWQKMVNRMVIDNLVMKSMQADLEKWYDDLVALQRQRTNGEIDDKTYKERLATLKGNYKGIVNSGWAMIDTYTKEGIIQPIKEVTKYFEDLADSWTSALTDMTKTSKDWKNDLIDQVLDDLVESSVMQAPFDAMIDGAEKHFDTFALYLENWNERYKEIIEDTTLTDEKRTAKLKAMIDEQGTAYDKQSAKSKQLADGIGKDMTEAFSNSLDNLGDTLIDALLDTEKDAAQVSKEIGQTLAKEMLSEMLSAEKYANWKEDIRKMWQAILKGEDTEHTIDDVLGEITKLNEAIANDEDIDKVVKKYQGWAKTMEEASTSFGDFHDTVMDAILDMENGLDDFATDMNQKLVKNLIEKQVFSIPIDITWQDKAMHFAKGFDEYQKNWTQRYYDIYNDVTLSEEKREKLLQALVDEMIAQEQILNGAAQDLAKRAQKKKVDTTFTDMTDSFVSALMDMDGNLEDFANDMKKTIVQKLVEGFMVSDQIKPLLDDLQATFNYAIGLDGAEIKERAAIINDGYTEILEDGTKVVHKGINELTDTLSPLKDKVKSVLEFIGYKFNETEDEIEENINDFTSTLNSALTSGETKASDFAQQLKEHIVNSLIEAYTATEAFQNGLNEVTDRLYHAIESGNELAITLAQQEAADFFDSATKAVERYTKALDTASDQTKKFDGVFDGMASDMLSTLMDFNSTAEDWAEMLGKNISQKIANEIVSTAVITPIINELNTAMQEAIAGSTLADGSIDWTNLYGEGSPLMLYIKALEERFPQLKQTFIDLLKGFGVSVDEAAKEGFPDLTGTFVSALSDIDMTAEKFGRQIGKTMAEQMVKAYIDNKYGETMKDLNKRWFDALEKNDIGAIENIKKEIVDMYKTLANPEEEPELEGLLSAIREIEKQLDTTFSGMTDSWVSALMDMEGTADDFAKTVGKTMAQKILTDIIAPVYIQPLLNEMQETFNAVISQVGATWQEAAAAMRPYLQQVKEAYYEVQPIVQELLGSFDIYKESVQEAAEEVEYALQDLKSNFVSSLMDMTSSAEDFSKEISKILAQNWIENYVLGAKFDQQMEYWKRQYESIIGSGMSEAERKRQLTALRDSIATAKQSYVNQAMAIQELLGITADSNEQQATMNMADKITYDQADQLLGVNIAQQLTLEQILATLQGGKVVPSAYTLGTGAGLTGNDEQSKLILANLQSMSAMMQDRQDAMLTQVAMANSYLQMIRDYNKRMCDQVELHMASMDNKLTSLRKL